MALTRLKATEPKKMNDLLDRMLSDDGLLYVGLIGICVIIGNLIWRIREAEMRTRRMRRDKEFQRWQDQ